MRITEHYCPNQMGKLASNVPGYFLPAFKEISAQINGGNHALEFFASSCQQVADTNLFFCNTLNAQNLKEAQKYIDQQKNARSFYLFNSFHFKENEHSKKLRKHFDLHGIEEFNILDFFKKSDASTYRLIDVKPHLYNCRCSVYNILLSRGAELRSTDHGQRSVLKTYALSFNHGVNIVVNPTNQTEETSRSLRNPKSKNPWR